MIFNNTKPDILIGRLSIEYYFLINIFEFLLINLRLNYINK